MFVLLLSIFGVWMFMSLLALASDVRDGLGDGRFIWLFGYPGDRLYELSKKLFIVRNR
ncbi:hypothetical protein LCGC14_0141360 [marine sediment metagenome]|uniref:Uncharacterized protein n=1 Tax=marine sediment metagenome TaxID=412755 RepID=A0A0F9V0Z9_9ZZZZ